LFDVEDLYQYIEETVSELAKAEFELFRRIHEKRIRSVPALRKRFTEEALNELSKKPFLLNKMFFTKEEIIDSILSLGETEIRTLVENNNRFQIAKKFHDWKDHLLILLKLEYLNGLLAGKEKLSKESKVYTHPAGVLAICFGIVAVELDEDWLHKQRDFDRLGLELFHEDMEASGLKVDGTNAPFHKAKTNLMNTSDKREAKALLIWAEKNRPKHHEKAVGLYEKRINDQKLPDFVQSHPLALPDND